MKFEKIGKICKKNKYCVLWGVRRGADKPRLYVNTSYSVYPVPENFPPIGTTDELAALFGWTAKDMNATYIDSELLDNYTTLTDICLLDAVQGEKPCKELDLGLIYNGRMLLGLLDDEGNFGVIDAGLPAPLHDEMVKSGYFQYYRRQTPDGRSYYVLKDGTYLRAILLPIKMRKPFFEKLDELYAAARSMSPAMETEAEE